MKPFSSNSQYWQKVCNQTNHWQWTIPKNTDLQIHTKNTQCVRNCILYSVRGKCGLQTAAV